MRMCVVAGCPYVAMLHTTTCIVHTPEEGSTYYGTGGNVPTYDPLGSEEYRRVDISSPKEQKPIIPFKCKECEICRTLSIIPMCWYRFGPFMDVGHVCDIWVCFGCGLRTADHGMRAHLPDTLDHEFKRGWIDL
jgi:hypothetical protein